VRRHEEPSPVPPSHRCRLCSSKTYRLDVRGRRITGYPTCVDRRDVRAAPRSPDHRWSSLILLAIVVDDPHKPATLGGMAGRALAHQRIYGCSRWNCFRGGWLQGIGLFPATLSSVVGAGWLWSSSLLVYWRHRAALSVGGSTPAGWSISGASDTYTEHRSISPFCNTTVNKSSIKRLPYLHRNIDKQGHSFTLGAGRPSLKACIRSSLRTKLLSVRLNNSFINRWTSNFSKPSRCILVGSWLPSYSYAECTLLWQGMTRQTRKFPTTPGPSWQDQSIRSINSAT